MATLPSKPWFQSKAVWVGIIAIVIAAWNTAATQFSLPQIPEFVYAILAFLGIYSRVVADKVIE